MEPKDILKWVKSNIKPIHDGAFGNRYWCAAILNDDLYLPYKGGRWFQNDLRVVKK
jgi:hypothetical protein